MNVHAAKPAGTAPMSELEWQTRVDLAACYRLVDHFGMTDLHLNHISARVPGNDEHFLINPFGMLYEEITASSLIKIDLAGNIVANTGAPQRQDLKAPETPTPDRRAVPRRARRVKGQVLAMLENRPAPISCAWLRSRRASKRAAPLTRLARHALQVPSGRRASRQCDARSPRGVEQRAEVWRHAWRLGSGKFAAPHAG